ncbi:MAG: class I SAM-dependent methyltransferase [Nanoarchaeota archaeon]|nr:class I SAM-dependent methyltransferase [Nanoarchaeota archaeon]
MKPFPEGTDLKTELRNAMGRLEKLGVVYPEGHYETLLSKYQESGVEYPRILMRIGKPNIRNFKEYSKILKMNQPFLDYGCGTCEDMRALISDGYDKSKVTGYDTNWNSINLGFDLFLDKKNLEKRLVVGDKFPFKKEQFGIIYSGSVIHTIPTKEGVLGYLNNAYFTLKKGCFIFGSTLGKTDDSEDMKRQVKPLKKEELSSLLSEAKFKDISIELKTNHPHDAKKSENNESSIKHRLWFYAEKGD